MIRESFAAIGNSARDLLKSPGTLGLLAVLYFLLLAAAYLFISTGVGSIFQLILTGFTVVLVPLLFFIVQASAAAFGNGESSSLKVFSAGLKSFLKILLVSIPLIGLVVLTCYLLAKLQSYFGPPAASTPHYVMSHDPLHATTTTPLRWFDVLLASVRLIVLGIVLPLVAIHYWLAITRIGLWASVKGTLRVVGQALSGRSVLIYSIGLVFFGLIPYFLVFNRTPVKNGWLELIVFGLRLTLTFLFTLCGWLITVRALGSRPFEGEVTAPVVETPIHAEPAHAA
jgi:hypothetical protein